MESDQTPDRPGPTTPRRHGRRARPLTPEEQAELDARKAEYERLHGPIASGGSGASSSAPAVTAPLRVDAPPSAASDSSASTPRGVAPRSFDPVALREDTRATPSLRRFGRRARVIEIDDEHASASPAPENAREASPGQSTTPQGVQRDVDGVELGEMPVGEAPEPKPAPRFEGRVLHRPERSGGSPVVWIVWTLIALALIALVVLLATGMLGGGSAHALAASTVRSIVAAADPATAGPAYVSTQEVIAA